MTLERFDAMEAWEMALEERRLALDERDQMLESLFPAAKRAIRWGIGLFLTNIAGIVANLVLWR